MQRTRDDLMSLVRDLADRRGTHVLDAVHDLAELGLITGSDAARAVKQARGERVPFQGRWMVPVGDSGLIAEVADSDDGGTDVVASWTRVMASEDRP